MSEVTATTQETEPARAPERIVIEHRAVGSQETKRFKQKPKRGITLWCLRFLSLSVGMATVCLMAAMFIYEMHGGTITFIENNLGLIAEIKNYMIIGTLSLLAIEFSLKKGLLMFSMGVAVVFIVLGFSFFPEFITGLIGLFR